MNSPAGPPTRRPALRIVATAWGSAYVDEFLTYCLPALLAPGNLPALAEAFAVEFIFLTETRHFRTVREHPACAAARAHCEFRLVANDDLVVVPKGSYGMALSYTLFRGFRDLGAKMTDTWIIFINSDFILADGSYRSLLPRLQDESNRLVFAPSYCALQEEVRPLLRAASAADGSRIAVPPRTMADWILRHRHYTIRAKTVNQRIGSIETHDQYYWIADEHTLLARQFPVALVAMKPERALEDIGTLWDYGVVADFCPGMRHAAITDSDEFLALELRDRDRAKKELDFGWKPPRRIARGLYNVITDYTRQVSRDVYVVHARDVPAGIGGARAALDAYVDDILARLPGPPPSHVEHPQWTVHFKSFHTLRNAYLGRRGDAAITTDAGLEPDAPRRGTGAELKDAAEAAMRTMAAAMCLEADDNTKSLTGGALVADMQFQQAHALFRQRMDESAQATVQRLVAIRSGEVAADAGLASDDPAMEARRLPLHDSERAHRLHLHELGVQLIHWSNAARDRASAAIWECTHVDIHAYAVERFAAYGTAPAAAAPSLAQRLGYALFGKRPDFRPWNAYRSATRLACDAARAASGGRRCLVLGKENMQILQSIVDDAKPVVLPIEASKLPGGIRACLAGDEHFDCCLVEGSLADLAGFRHTVEEVRPFLRDGATLVAFFLNPGLDRVTRRDADYVRSVLPAGGPARIAFCGSLPGLAAFAMRSAVETVLHRYLRLPGAVAVAAALLLAAPAALLATLLESGRSLDNAWLPRRRPTSVTIEIRFG